VLVTFPIETPDGEYCWRLWDYKCTWLMHGQCSLKVGKPIPENNGNTNGQGFKKPPECLALKLAADA
jgi:hypothetical protein